MARAVVRAGNESTVVAGERRFASANPAQLALTVARAVPGARRHVGGAKRERAGVEARLAVPTERAGNVLIANAGAVLAHAAALQLFWQLLTVQLGPTQPVLQ